MTEATLGQIVSRIAGAARVFSAFGLDYICWGERRVAEACRKKSVDVKAVMAALEGIECQAGDDRLLGWETASTEALITHIVEQYHRPLLRALERIKALVSDILDSSAGNDPRLESALVIVNELVQDMPRHIRQEEEDLFPDLMLGRGYAASMSVRINCLQHRDTINALESLRGLTEGYRVAESQTSAHRALIEELADLDTCVREHLHLETNVLFPAALRT